MIKYLHTQKKDQTAKGKGLETEKPKADSLPSRDHPRSKKDGEVRKECVSVSPLVTPA